MLNRQPVWLVNEEREDTSDKFAVSPDCHFRHAASLHPDACGPVRDYETAKRFYAEALRPLGFEILLDWPDRKRAYFGVPSRPSSFWVVESTFAGSLEVSVAVPDGGSVAAFHAASLAAGGRSLAEPGVQSEHNDGHYSARIADFDGNEIEAVHRVAASELVAA